MRARVLVGAAAGFLMAAAGQAAASGTASGTDSDADEWGGLPPGEGREVVYSLCSACHSLMLVRQQHLSRTRWTHTLEMMVEDQGMPELDPETLDQVLDYLAEHYGRPE